MRKVNKRLFYLKMVVSSLLRRRTRMLVALLAVAIGATILSGLTTIYYDIPRQMGQEFRSYGANMVIVPSGDEASLSTEEMQKALSYLPKGETVGVAPYRYQIAKINEQPFMAAGTNLQEIQKTRPYWFVAGEWPQEPKSVLIGQEVANVIRLTPGALFTLTGVDAKGGSFSQEFKVAGIVQTGGNEEAFIFMSMQDFESMMGDKDKVDVIECSISASGDALNAIIANINDNVPTVAPRLVKRVTASEEVVLTKLQALVYLVTVVVLLLTMICVATTMMAVVAERRKEIGLKKALGAANKSIIAEFLGEGMFLGCLGGLLGVVFGFAFAQLISLNVFGRPIVFQPLMLPVTLFSSVAITGIACLIPVRSATKVDPAIVLRGE